MKAFFLSERVDAVFYAKERVAIFQFHFVMLTIDD